MSRAAATDFLTSSKNCFIRSFEEIRSIVRSFYRNNLTEVNVGGKLVKYSLFLNLLIQLTVVKGFVGLVD